MEGEEGEDAMYDSETDSAIAEMMHARFGDSSDDNSEEGDEDEGLSEDSFENKYGEKRFEIIEEKKGEAALGKTQQK